MKRLILTLAMLLIANPAMAVCEVPQPRLVCAEYFASQVVVEATVTKIRDVGDDKFPTAFIYSLRANQLLRGHIAGTFDVYESNDSGRAAFDWKVGKEYILFLSYSQSDKGWELDGCGNSGPLDHAKLTLDEIAMIHKRHGDGFIRGVVSSEAPPNPMSNVRVEARGAHRTYTATTDTNGEFAIKVPPGRYVVRASKGSLSFSGDALSYSDPNDIRIEPGGCAQVQLTANH